MSAMGYKPATSENKAPADSGLTKAIREYVCAYVRGHGRRRAAEVFGVSRHTLWRFLRRGHTGRFLPCAVLQAVVGNQKDLEAATLKLILGDSRRSYDDTLRRLPEELEDTLLLLCATPLATAKELSHLKRVPISTLRERLRELAQQGLVDSVSHRLTALGPRPQRRYFPNQTGIIAAGVSTHGNDHVLQCYPVSRQWLQLLAERMDTVAVLYHTAAMVADADPRKKPVRVDLYRQGPYDMLISLSEDRSIGIMRQGPMLPTANFRYRLRSSELLPNYKKPIITLILTHSDQATRRAIRTLGDHANHHGTFVATEGELLAGDHGVPCLASLWNGHEQHPAGGH